MRRDAVDCVNLAFRVDVPKESGRLARKSANPPIEAAGEHHAGDRGDGSRLRGAAAGNLAAAGGRRPPDFFSGIELQCHETPASLGVQEKRPARIVRDGLRARGSRRNDDNFEVRHGDVDIALIRGHAPLHAAELAAVSNPLLPDDLAGAIRIERGHDPGFLGADQNALTAGKLGEEGGRSEIIVGSVGLRTIHRDGPTASEVVGVPEVIWRDHANSPEFASNARIASDVVDGGSE